MTDSPVEKPSPNPLWFSGISAFAFAACPTISLGLMLLIEFFEPKKPSGMAIAAVPPISFIWFILLIMSSPWIITGIMLIGRQGAGRWIAIVLTFPTALISLFTAGGTIVGMKRTDSLWALDISAFGPITIGGLLYCLTVWGTEIVLRKRVK